MAQRSHGRASVEDDDVLARGVSGLEGVRYVRDVLEAVVHGSDGGDDAVCGDRGKLVGEGC